MYQDLLNWEESIYGLLKEGRVLMERVARLELQSQKLQESHANATYNSDGAAALSKLYDDGFHVCNVHFAQMRDADCLFCLYLLNQADKADANAGQ